MILDVLFKRSIENPNHPLTDDSYGYGTRSDSGLNITYTGAMKYSPWWRGVNLISRDVAKLPCYVYKRKGEGKDRDSKHPAYPLLRRKANAELTSFTFVQTLTANAMACGNGYGFIVRDRDARPSELRWLDPLQTYPVRENGVLLYVTVVNNSWRKLLPENVFHVRGLGFDGLSGYPVYQIAADSLGLGLGAQKYGARFFKNNARPSVVIEIPGTMTPEAQKTFLDQWNRMHGGLEEAHKTAILTMGGKVNAFSINAKDSMLLETRAFEIREVANWLGVPPHKLGDTTRTAYASLEQENHSYLVEALDPWLCAWENEANDKLLTEAQKETESHFVEFNRNALVRASFAERMAGYNTALQGGWMNRNEVRAKENMNPLPEGEGEKFYVPLNMNLAGGDVAPPKVQGGTLPELEAIIIAVVKGEIPADSAKLLIAAAYPGLTTEEISEMVDAAEEQEPPEPPEPVVASPPPAMGEMDTEEMSRHAMRGVIEDVAERMTRRICLAARKASKKPSEFLTWLDGLGEEHCRVVLDAITPVVELAKAHGGTADALEVAVKWLELWRRDLLELSGMTMGEGLALTVDDYLIRTAPTRCTVLTNAIGA